MILKNTVFAEIRCFLCGCVERKEKMTYTAKSREELIEQVKEYLKSEELHVKTEDENKGGYSLMYILIRKFSTEKTTVVASNESGGVFMFYPYDEQSESISAAVILWEPKRSLGSVCSVPRPLRLSALSDITECMLSRSCEHGFGARSLCRDTSPLRARTNIMTRKRRRTNEYLSA